MEKSDERQNGQVGEEKGKTLAPKTKRYWNPASYKYYIKYPTAVPPKSMTRNPVSNKQVKRLYLVSTAFKIAKIVAVVLIALFLIGQF